MPDGELLELQSVLLEHVLGTRIALESRTVLKNPAAALESVSGHADKLRRCPEAPPEAAGLDPSRSSPTPAALQYPRRFASSILERGTSGPRSFPLRSSLGSNCSSSGSGGGSAAGGSARGGRYFAGAAADGGKPPFPPRVAVVASDPITRTIVAGALATGAPPRTAVAVHCTLEAAAADEAEVVVVCASPSAPFTWATTPLPLRTPQGARRGFVVVGEVDVETQDAIFQQMTGWCELVRLSMPGQQTRSNRARARAPAASSQHGAACVATGTYPLSTRAPPPASWGLRRSGFRSSPPSFSSASRPSTPPPPSRSPSASSSSGTRAEDLLIIELQCRI